ncbi:ly6/PLAUR domain-containing protein 2-like [Dendropsophus ebraccatus]|uniref:ly6/PLAUR domain-containing protein 2-like n=1 Tax=Dendropsophus ebraccatus TaxID=150705 RepID=UPI003831B095
MAAYTSLLLVIALCATAAFSLRCYTCDSTSCLIPTTCPANTTACLRKVGEFLISVPGSPESFSYSRASDYSDGTSYGYGATAVTTMMCVPSCSLNITTNMSKAVTCAICCTTDLCNGSPAITCSYTAIILALGSVLQSSVL